VKSIKSDSDEQKRSSVFQEKINMGDTAELAETVMTKKGRQFFSGKNRGVTPSVAALGDATVQQQICLFRSLKSTRYFSL